MQITFYDFVLLRTCRDWTVWMGPKGHREWMEVMVSTDALVLLVDLDKTEIR